MSTRTRRRWLRRDSAGVEVRRLEGLGCDDGLASVGEGVAAPCRSGRVAPRGRTRGAISVAFPRAPRSGTVSEGKDAHESCKVSRARIRFRRGAEELSSRACGAENKRVVQCSVLQFSVSPQATARKTGVGERGSRSAGDTCSMKGRGQTKRGLDVKARDMLRCQRNCDSGFNGIRGPSKCRHSNAPRERAIGTAGP